jgi:hypothetical protein
MGVRSLIDSLFSVHSWQHRIDHCSPVTPADPACHSLVSNKPGSHWWPSSRPAACPGSLLVPLGGAVITHCTEGETEAQGNRVTLHCRDLNPSLPLSPEKTGWTQEPLMGWGPVPPYVPTAGMTYLGESWPQM